MVNLISDNHGFEFAEELLKYQPREKDDLLIILGDTCLRLADTREYNDFSQWLLSRKYNIAIVDGNHENYEYLDSMPEEIWHGGKINRLTDNIVRLRRGELYSIENKSYFVFGGCTSGAKWKAKGFWHSGDVPTDAQLENAYANLKKAGYRVDIILSHKYFCDQCLVHPGEEEYRLFLLNRFIDANVSFEKWYSGHRHEKRDIDGKHTVIFDELRTI